MSYSDVLYYMVIYRMKIDGAVKLSTYFTIQMSLHNKDVDL